MKDPMYFYIGMTEQFTSLSIGVNSIEFSLKHYFNLSDVEEESQKKYKKKPKKVLYKRDYNK